MIFGLVSSVFFILGSFFSFVIKKKNLVDVGAEASEGSADDDFDEGDAGGVLEIVILYFEELDSAFVVELELAEDEVLFVVERVVEVDEPGVGGACLEAVDGEVVEELFWSGAHFS